jgi:hypothetical protein
MHGDDEGVLTDGGATGCSVVADVSENSSKILGESPSADSFSSAAWTQAGRLMRRAAASASRGYSPWVIFDLSVDSIDGDDRCTRMAGRLVHTAGVSRTGDEVGPQTFPDGKDPIHSMWFRLQREIRTSGFLAI